jgi:hypothetical protein
MTGRRRCPALLVSARALYRGLLAQSELAVLVETFRADRYRLVNSAAVNRFVSRADPVTGRRGRVYLVTVMAGARPSPALIWPTSTPSATRGPERSAISAAGQPGSDSARPARHHGGR